MQTSIARVIKNWYLWLPGVFMAGVLALAIAMALSDDAVATPGGTAPVMPTAPAPAPQPAATAPAQPSAIAAPPTTAPRVATPAPASTPRPRPTIPPLPGR